MIDLNTALEHDEDGLPKINKAAAINDRGNSAPVTPQQHIPSRFTPPRRMAT